MRAYIYFAAAVGLATATSTDSLTHTNSVVAPGTATGVQLPSDPAPTATLPTVSGVGATVSRPTDSRAASSTVTEEMTPQEESHKKKEEVEDFWLHVLGGVAGAGFLGVVGGFVYVATRKGTDEANEGTIATTAEVGADSECAGEYALDTQMSERPKQEPALGSVV